MAAFASHLRPRIVPRRPEISIGILVAGGLVYGALCIPAIGRRGFPPIDPLWMAMPYLWIGPLALSALFDGPWSRSRCRHLLAYALFTAFVDAGTWEECSPRHMDPVFMGALTLVPFGPLHIVVAALVELFLQSVLRIWRVFDPDTNVTPGLPRLSLAEWLVGYTVLTVTVGFPFAFRSYTWFDERVRGRSSAEEDWKNHVSGWFGGLPSFHHNGQYRQTQRYDSATGFRSLYDLRGHDHFWEAYNRRTTELLHQHGNPAWSMKQHLVPVQALITRLNSSDGIKIDSMPCEVTPSIVVFLTGTIERWGAIMNVDARGGGSVLSNTGNPPQGISFFGGAGAAPLAIATAKIGLLTAGHGPDSAFIDYDAADPDVVYVRYGTNWIGLFHRDGYLLQAVEK